MKNKKSWEIESNDYSSVAQWTCEPKSSICVYSIRAVMHLFYYISISTPQKREKSFKNGQNEANKFLRFDAHLNATLSDEWRLKNMITRVVFSTENEPNARKERKTNLL